MEELRFELLHLPLEPRLLTALLQASEYNCVHVLPLKQLTEVSQHLFIRCVFSDVLSENLSNEVNLHFFERVILVLAFVGLILYYFNFVLIFPSLVFSLRP